MIDWSQLSATLAARLERALSAAQATPLADGHINQVFRLDCGAERLFSKLNGAGREVMPIANTFQLIEVIPSVAIFTTSTIC